MDDNAPAFLTIEEASRLLRIGRTKAYAMAKEWRETGGQSGLPVVDLGHVLRVPREGLEQTLRPGRPGNAIRPVRKKTPSCRLEPPPSSPAVPAPPRSHRDHHEPPNQLLLFEALPFSTPNPRQARP